MRSYWYRKKITKGQIVLAKYCDTVDKYQHWFNTDSITNIFKIKTNLKNRIIWKAPYFWLKRITKVDKIINQQIAIGQNYTSGQRIYEATTTNWVWIVTKLNQHSTWEMNIKSRNHEKKKKYLNKRRDSLTLQKRQDKLDTKQFIFNNKLYFS